MSAIKSWTVLLCIVWCVWPSAGLGSCGNGGVTSPHSSKEC